ncbi:ATP-binding protein [Nonomuraea rubra]
MRHWTGRTRFDESCLKHTRRVLLHAARERGLDGARLDDFLLTTDEGVVNTVAHGGGGGGLSLCCAAASCAARSATEGLVFPADSRRRFPSATGRARRRGIWLMRRLADEVAFTTGPEGTAVLLSMRLSPPIRGSYRPWMRRPVTCCGTMRVL